MEVGVVGKPNVGKSTFFSALTLAKAEVAAYPFTTIDANKGVGYVRAECPHVEFEKPCTPNNSRCIDGVRYIPIELIDVAGLVPDAHTGKGLGNKFLDDLRQAHALVHIIDASGSTDAEGNPIDVGGHDPLDDVSFLENEIDQWIKAIMKRDWGRVSRTMELSGGKIERALAERLTGLRVKEYAVHHALLKLKLSDKPSTWTEEELLELAKEVRLKAKPMILAANKADRAPPENLEALKGVEGAIVIPTSAEYELALRRASEAGMISYNPGSSDFDILAEDKLNKAQLQALERIREFLAAHGSTGVQEVLEKAVFDLLDLVPVFPVEDENHLTDKEGRVLPDAFLLPKGSTAKDLAYKVHTDLGDNFIRAIDARTHRVIGADHELKASDVIRIVANA